MNVLFIRHAEAAEADEWPADDWSRPLTRRGQKQASELFRFLRKKGLRCEAVFCSEALRARQTAELFAGRVRRRTTVSPLLNPGCTVKKLRQLARASGRASIAVVGHEPDFSAIIAELAGASGLRLKMAKGACAMVELREDRRGALQWLLPPFPVLAKKPG